MDHRLTEVLQVVDARSGHTPEEGTGPIEPKLTEGPITREGIYEDGARPNGRIKNAP